MFVVKWALLLVKLLHQLVYWTFTGELVVFLTNSTHIGCAYETFKTRKLELYHFGNGMSHFIDKYVHNTVVAYVVDL